MVSNLCGQEEAHKFNGLFHSGCLFNIKVFDEEITYDGTLMDKGHKAERINVVFPKGLYPFGSFLLIELHVGFALDYDAVCIFEESFPAFNNFKWNT